MEAVSCLHVVTMSVAVYVQAMLLMVGKEAYKAELSSTFESLAHDGSWRVRKTIAAGFHEVC